MLPTVTATLTFTVIGTADLKNSIRFEHADGFVVATTDPRVAAGNYLRETFKGPEADLKRLEENSDSWWYVVRVPDEKLPRDTPSETVALAIEFFHAASLGDLDVEFIPNPPTLLVEIKRAP